MSLVAVPRELLEKKPPHGAQCNNCGLCCWTKKCDIGRAIFGAVDDGPCPALRFTDGVSSCGVVEHPENYIDHDVDEARAAALLLLYAGHGCTMRINGEWNTDFMNRLSDFDAWNKHALKRAAELWGVSSDTL